MGRLAFSFASMWALSLVGCSTFGVQSEARVLAEAATRIDVSLRSAHDIGLATDLARFTGESSIDIVTREVCLGWVDASCDQAAITNEGRSLCAIGIFPRNENGSCPAQSDLAQSATPLETRAEIQDVATRRYEIESAHRSLVGVFDQLARLAGAESTDTVNAYVQSTNAFGNAAIQANRSAAEHELEDYRKTKSPDAARVKQLEQQVEAARLAASATSASFDLTASVVQDLFEWLLAKKRRRYVADSIHPLVERAMPSNSAPIDGLTSVIAQRADRVLGTAHEYWQKQLSDEFDALQELADSGEKLESEDDDPTGWSGSHPPNEEKAPWQQWQAQYDRFRAAREIVVLFESLQIAATHDPSPPDGDSNPAGIAKGVYVSRLGELLREYGDSARILRRAARKGKKSATATAALFDFDARAGAVLDRVTRLDALIQRRIAAERAMRPWRNSTRDDEESAP